MALEVEKVERKTTAEPNAIAALEENVEAIRTWERESLLSRTRTEQIADWIAATGAGGPVFLLHVLWFGTWVTINIGWVPGVAPFDPFPFPLLTTVVSLEAIFLAWFVLASQNRLARQSDKRSHLNLQVDLLAEREMTAMLQLLQDIARHLNVKTTVTSELLRDLAKKTDVRSLTDRVEEFSAAQSASDDVAEGGRSPRGTHLAQSRDVREVPR